MTAPLTPPPAAPATTAMVIERLRSLRAAISNGDYDTTGCTHAEVLPDVELLSSAITHLTALSERCAALEEDALHGKLIAAGDLELFEDGKPVAITGVFVECTHEALRNLRGNLIYSEVSIAARPSVAARGHKEGV